MLEFADEFSYTSVTHAKGPIAANFDVLVESGHIKLDLLLRPLRRTQCQKPKARDHGYFFKMAPRDLSFLFPRPVPYDLTERC